jgi:DNA modification methylase
VTVRIICGDALAELRKLPDDGVHCCVTSPPYYGLRDYGVAGQLGLEASPDEYVAALVEVFREVRRVLRSDGTFWLNIGDSYAGSWGAQSRRITESDAPSWHSSQIKNHPKRASNTGTIRAAAVKPKDLYGIPWMVAFALRADGWWLRRDIIWSKPNPMPESVTDRPTTAHEYLFLLSKAKEYHYDERAIRERAVGTEPGDLDGGAQRLPDGSAANAGRNYREPNSPQSIASPYGQGTRRASRSGNKERKPASARGVPIDTGGKTAGAVAGSVPWEGFSRNKRSVWVVPTTPYPEAHFATFPPDLVEPCVLAGCPPLGTVLDPFAGAGTTGLVADRLGRNAVLIELNPVYAEMARRRIQDDAPLFAEVATAAASGAVDRWLLK